MFIRLVIFAAVFGFTGLVATASADECRLKRFASIPMTVAPNGPALIDVSIDGEPAKLVFDTGSAVSLLDEGYVNRRKLPAADFRRAAYGLTGKELHGGVRVKELSLGTAIAPDQLFRVGHTGDDGGGGGPVGVFGTDFLADFDVEIDPSAGRINLFLPNQCPGNVVYWAKEYFRLPIYVPQGVTLNRRMVAVIKVNDVGLHGLIDTGTGETTMRLAVAHDSFDLTPEPAAGGGGAAIRGVDGTAIAAFHHVFEGLTFGDITLNKTDMVIADIDVAKARINTGSRIAGAPNQPDVLIGMSLLKRLHMFIAYGEQAVYYTVAEPKAPRTE
jgi:hypothetical protein